MTLNNGSYFMVCTENYKSNLTLNWPFIFTPLSHIKCFLTFGSEQYFPVVLFIMLYKVVLTFKSEDEIIKGDHSNESY